MKRFIMGIIKFLESKMDAELRRRREKLIGVPDCGTKAMPKKKPCCKK